MTPFPFNLDQQIVAARVIRSMGAPLVPTEERILQACRAGWGGVDFCVLRRNFGVSQAIAVVTGNTLRYNLVFLAGVKFDGALRLQTGWEEADRIPQTFHFNSQAAFDALDLLRLISGVEETEGKVCYCFGHSGGGAVAEAFARIGNVRVLGLTRGVCTFGMPMVATGGQYEPASDSFARIRYMNRGDIVTGFPYINLNTQLFSSSRLGKQALYGAIWRHPGQGLLLDGRRRPQERYVSIESLPISTLDVVDWMTRAENDETHPHSMLRYIESLIALKDAGFADEVVVAVAGDVPEQPPVSGIRLERAIRAANNSNNVVFQADDESFVPQPTDDPSYTPTPNEEYRMTVTVSNNLKATVNPIGDLFAVVWMGEPIYLAATATAAKRLAQDVNRLTRRMTKATAVDPGGFEIAASNFFRVATLPGGGYNPPLNGFDI